jgi:hypothetical protein
VKAKYLRNKSVAMVKPCIHDSPGWKTLLKVKDYYFEGRRIVLKKGDLVRFWIDPWLDDKPLCEVYSNLFDICQGQEWTFEKCSVVISMSLLGEGCYLVCWFIGILSKSRPGHGLW